LLLIVLTVANSVQGANWTTSLQNAMGILPLAAAGGLIVGFLLSRLQWLPRVIAHLLGLIAGVGWIVQLSATLRSVSIPGSPQIVHYLPPELGGWKDLALELLLRIIFLGRTFMRGSPGEDIVLFVIVLGLVCWLLGFLGAWFSFRSHWPWLAVALPAVVLLLNIYYGPSVPPRYFHFFAFLSLLFLIYYLWKRQEQNWQQDEVRYPRELPRGVFWVGVLFSAVLVLGAAFLPTTVASEESTEFWDRYLEPWREVRGTWERLFSEVEGPGEGRLRGYAPTFDLTGARTSPSGIAFEIKTTRNDYLRGLSFDQYDGRGWTNTAEQGPIWNLASGQRIPISQRRRIRVFQVITPIRQGGNMLFAVAEPLSMTVSAVIELGAEPSSEAGFEDIVTIHARTGLVEGRSYGVVSLLSMVDKATLREIDLDYPEWVRERYLQLPETLPERIRTLSDQVVGSALEAGWENSPDLPVPTLIVDDETSGDREVWILPAQSEQSEPTAVITIQEGRITSVYPSGALVQSGLVNPYDAAEAIEGFLRTEHTYREDISAPPLDRDAVDYFLFESKAGYCDYFGSAMVVMMRTQGIPARLIRGYATGEYDQEKGLYVVPVSSAHTWAEVYFPNYGWQRFEPTAADYTRRPDRPENPPEEGPRPPRTPRAEIDLGEEEFDPLDRVEDIDLAEGEGVQAGGFVQSITRPAILAPTVIAFLSLAALAILSIRMGRGLRGLTPIAATYERMCRWENITGLAPDTQPTPYEYAWHLAEALPEQRPNIALIATLYVRERFGRYVAQSEEISRVRQAWKELRWPLWGRLTNRMRRTKVPEAEEDAE
jgi:transglutaminase-like putative cysteine protease